MGQYYKPVALNSLGNVMGWVYTHDIKFKFKRSDGTTIMLGHGLKLMEHSYINNDFMRAIERLLIPNGAWHKKPIVWAGDYAPKEKDKYDEENQLVNLYDLCSDNTKLIPKPLSRADSKKYRYIVNHTKKQFVDKNSVPDYDGWRIHPLSLLTAEGNGSGGGDYYGSDPNRLVGSWSRDIISVESEAPEGYEVLNFNLVE